MAGGMKMYGKHRFPGRLFIVEGIDGSGKSTQLMLLKKWLESEGYVVYSSEWNSSPLVHDVTKRGKKKKMLTPITFSLIHATDFADRTEHHIIPPLKAGAVAGAGHRRIRAGSATSAPASGRRAGTGRRRGPSAPCRAPGHGCAAARPPAGPRS